MFTIKPEHSVAAVIPPAPFKGGGSLGLALLAAPHGKGDVLYPVDNCKTSEVS
jgi:hypothetical protein